MSETPNSWESDPAGLRRLTRPAMLGAAAVLAAGLLFAWGGGEQAVETPVAGATGEAPVPEQARELLAEALPTVVRVSLNGLPEGAMVTVDGEPMPGSDFELPRGEENRRIEVSAEGYAALLIVHQPTRDAVIAITLQKLAAPAVAKLEPPPAVVETPALPRPAPRPKRPATKVEKVEKVQKAVTPAAKPPERIVEELDF